MMRRKFRKLRMYCQAVITLGIIMQDQLPIVSHIVLDPYHCAQGRQVPARKFSRQRREPFLQRHVAASLRRGVFCRVCEIHENESFPQDDVHRAQRIIGRVEARDIIHVRCAKQSSVQSVRPCVIRTLHRRGQLSVPVFNEATSAMAAHVVKAMDLSAFIPDNDQALAGDLCSKIITGFCDLTLMANQHPLLGENLLLLFGEYGRRNEIPLWQSLRTRFESLCRFAELWRCLCLRRVHRFWILTARCWMRNRISMIRSSIQFRITLPSPLSSIFGVGCWMFDVFLSPYFSTAW